MRNPARTRTARKVYPKQEKLSWMRALVLYQERGMPKISLAFVNPCDDMAAVFQVQLFIIIIVCLHSRSSYGFKLPCNGIKIVTYGEPCHSGPRYLPVTIEEPAKPAPELVSPEPCVYQPLKLNYRVISTKPAIPHLPRPEYPISIQVPQVSQPLKIITPDTLRGKSYAYNIQAMPSQPVPITTTYDFDFQVPPSPLPTPVPTPQPVKLLTGLTSKIDRILIPACQVPSSGCCKTAL